MADIIAFPRGTVARSKRYTPAKIVGAKSGITVRILSRIGSPHDLLVVLDGTADGTTTVAATPASEMAVAEAIANSVLAALEVAEVTWSAQEVAWSR